MESSKQSQFTIEQLLSSYISSIADENPMEYLNDMYKSINPMVIHSAAATLKQELRGMNEKGGETVNVFMNLGSDSMTRSFYQGNLATLLWLPAYINEASTAFGVSAKDKETTLRVLRSMHLPTIKSAVYENEGKLESSSTRYFATFMAALTGWLSQPVYVGKNQTITDLKQGSNAVTVKTNLEIVRFVSSVALGSFPSIPFASYYLGSINTTDPMDLSEKLSQRINFREYMSDQSIQINQPRITVQYDMTPIVGMMGHPLATTILGRNDQENNCQWYGLFAETEEFSKLCQKHGHTTKSVKKYMFTTPKKKHDENILKNVPIATFINKHVVLQTTYEDTRKLFEKNYEDIKGYLEYQGIDPSIVDSM